MQQHSTTQADDNRRSHAVVAFGAGFHQIAVYNPGTEPENIVVPPSPPPPTNAFINDPTNRFYLGINPPGGPLGTPGTTNPSNAPMWRHGGSRS
jgi:hypothetical protein